MSQVVIGNYTKSFDDTVYDLLADTPFNIGEEFSKTLQRAKSHRDCGKFDVGMRCANADCAVVLFRYRRDCNMRGCRSCWKRLRSRLVGRYASRLKDYDLSQLQFVTLSYRWSYTEMAGRSADYLMRKANEWCKWFGFSGALFSIEATEKIGGFWYVHLHGIVVDSFSFLSAWSGVESGFNWSAMGGKWGELSGSRNVKFRAEFAVRERLMYMFKYAVKDWIAEGGSGVVNPVEYVSLLKVLYRKKLVRAFGCLRGVGRSASRKPRLGVVVGGDEDQALDEDETGAAPVIPVGVSSTNSYGERTCPRCLGHDFVWFEEPHVEDRPLEVVSGGAG